jgi:hypothetical protein
MKKFLLISIPVATIGVFVLIMNSGFLFERPDNYSVSDHAESIRQSIVNDDWTAVENEINQMKDVIEKRIFPFIQFSVEKNEMIDLDLNISRIKGCIDSKNKSMALVYVQELLNNWHNLNR